MRLFYTLQPKRASAWWGAVYAFFIALTTLYGYFYLITLPWFVVQLSYAVIISLAVVWIMVYGELSRVRSCFTMMLVQMAPLLFALAWSTPIWLIHHDSTRTILRGVSVISYQLLLLIMLHIAGIMFGPNVILFTLYGFICGNAMILMDVVRRFGPSGTVTALINFALHGTEGKVIGALEVQDLTFAFGAIIIYLIIYTKDSRRRLFIAMSFVFFALGWKRAAFLGVIIGVAFTWVMERCSRKDEILLTTAIGVMLVLIGFGWVVLVRSEVLMDVADSFGINMMGRDKIYRLVQPYYRLSPAFMGIGYMKVSTITQRLYERAIRGLHSDILRIYIELGFPGYFIWCSTVFVFTYRFMAKHYSIRTARSYMAVGLYLYLTYLTDNTAASYHTQIAWHVLPLAVYLEEMESGYVPVDNRRREKATLWKNQVALSKKQPRLSERMTREMKNREILEKLKKL